MKTNTFHAKKVLALLFTALLPLVASAQTKVEIDGIWYNLTAETREAEVTFKGNSYVSYWDEYSGSITIPATVTYGGGEYSVTSIGNSAFSHCESLTAITLPKGVTSIGSSAFYKCSSLTAITLPEGVTSIGGSAFEYCHSLTAITLPASLTSIGSYAFSGCYFTHENFINNSTCTSSDNWGAILCEKEYDGILVQGEMVILCRPSVTSATLPEGVTSIGNSAFSGCSSLTAITIPKGVTSIGSSAFSGCSSLTSITLPEGVTSIGGGAFWGCSSLTAITLPEGVTSIGEDAFRNCSSLTAINIPEGVTSIGEYAFYGCSSLTAINIPEGVTSIGDYAFYKCSSLTAINIPEGVTSIGNSFQGCSNLHSVVIGSGVLSIDERAFEDAPLEKVIWLTNTPPSGYSKANGKINYVANNKYSSLSNTKVYPYISSSFEVDGVTYVPNPADMTCDVIDCRYDSNITEVKIDNTVTYKGKQLQVCEVMPYVFYKNEDVESIVIYNDGSIGTNAFYNCKNLKTFEAGENVESIGDNAFYGCSSIENFTCYAKQPPVCGSMAINDIDKWECTLNVPEKAVERYKAADQWESFFFTEGFEVKPNIATFVIDGECYATVEVEYGEEITLPATPEKEGHTFTGWTDIPTIMPSNDVVVHGEFAKNTYKVEFIIDGKVYHSDEILYGDAIELIEEPTKEGYTFSGWSEVPETMPAEDVNISGTFIINKYLVTFKIDDEVIASDSLEYGANIVVPEAPEKEGYTFNGWGNVAWKVPAHDLTYEGTYKVNSYTLRYVVDDMSYKTVSVRYGDTITLIDEPTKEGYEFSGWSKAPETMPAEDVTITGTFKRLPSIYLTINQADNGYVKQHLVVGTVCAYTIEAAEGWKIHTVTFNGEDVTSQLTEEGTFTTPELQDDATLNIAYEKIDDAISHAQASRVKVQGHQGVISITGTTEGAAIGLYTTSGTLVATATAEGESTQLTVPTGQVYIVKVADTVVKIGM